MSPSENQPPLEREATPPVPETPAVDTTKHHAVFKRLSIDGDLPTEQLGWALSLLGYPHSDEEWLRELVDTMFNSRSYLDEEEFIAVTNAYIARFQTRMEQLFRETDLNDDGFLGEADITSMLRSLGVTPVPGLVKELIREVTGQPPSTAKVLLEHFVQIHNIVVDRAGFSASEAKMLQEVFARYDRDADGFIEEIEFFWCLTWMGFPLDQELTHELVLKADKDESGTLDPQEFYALMRMHREQEVEQLSRAFGNQDLNMSGTISGFEGIERVFGHLGYSAISPGVVQDARERLDLADKTELLFEDLYVLLVDIRQHESFLASELADVEATFDSFDKERQGMLGGIALLCAFKWLGYPLRFEHIEDVREEFDVKGNGLLNREEFKKLTRHYRQEAVKDMRDAFTNGDANQKGYLELSELKIVLSSLDVVPLSAELGEALSDLKEEIGEKLDHCSFWQFVRLVDRIRGSARDRLRRHHGFDDEEVQRFRMQFNGFDADRSGILHDRQLSNLIEELYPDVRSNRETHKKAKTLLETGDSDGDGMINFDDFLRMMRVVEEEALRDALATELRTIAACGYSKSEVKEFRKVFRMVDRDATGDVSFSELERMLSKLMPLGTKATQSLMSQLMSLDTDKDRSLDFPEFLRMMRKLQDENWNQINQHAAEVAEEEEEAAVEAKKSMRGGHR